MDENKFELYLFLDLIDIMIHDNYLNSKLWVNYNEKPWYGFFYNKNNRYIIKKDFNIDKSYISKEQFLFVKNVLSFLIWKQKNIKFILNEYKYIDIFINWYLNWCSVKYLKYLDIKNNDIILLLYIISKKDWELIYPEYYNDDYLEKLKYLFEESILQDSFIVNFLYFIWFHCKNFNMLNIWKIKKAFLSCNNIDYANPYLYSYYARFLIRTLWSIYKKAYIIKKWINYLLYSVDKLNNNDKFIYWRIASWCLYVKDYKKSILFAKKPIIHLVSEELASLQLARWYIYWKIDIDKWINILKWINDYRANKTLAVAYMYKLEFKKSKQYIYNFLNFLISRDDIIIEKNNLFYKKISKSKDLNLDDLLKEFSDEKYIYWDYRIVNWEWIEELCYCNYNNISDFSIIK